MAFGMGCRTCPQCGHHKDCWDELCIVCELKGEAIKKVKNIFGGKHEKDTGHSARGKNI